MELRLLANEIKYQIFRGEDFKRTKDPLLVNISDHWVSFWNKHFERAQTRFRVSNDLIAASDFFACFFYGEEPLAGHISSIWDPLSRFDLNRSYLRSYPSSVIDYLRERNMKKFMSIEYFYVSETHRKGFLGVPIADVLLNLALDLAERLTDGNVLATVRKKRGVDKRCEEWGFKTLRVANMHNNECAMMFCSKESRVADPREHVSKNVNLYRGKESFLNSLVNLKRAA